MNGTIAVWRGVVRGKTIELDREPGLPDGQIVAVTIEQVERKTTGNAVASAPCDVSWADRLVFDKSVDPQERIVKGTRVTAESVVAELEKGRSDQEILRAFPELTLEDVAALRQYAQVSPGLRMSFGAWADEAEELDQYLDWAREQRKVGRRAIEE